MREEESDDVRVRWGGEGETEGQAKVRCEILRLLGWCRTGLL